LNVYPIDLGATEAQQTMIASIATLPSALKIIFGFISDNVPIYGYRRKPYMLLGWMCTVGSMIILLYYTDLSVPARHSTSSHDEMQSLSSSSLQRESSNHKELPSMEWLMVTFFISGSGMWIADVMADAFVAQKVPFEPIEAQGQIQSTCYACRFFGIAAFAPVSTYLYNQGLFGYTGPATIVFILAMTPIITAFPLWFLLEEERNIPIPSTRHQCDEIWKTVCSRSVWQPIGFVYLYNILQVPNAAWRQYLKSVLLFTSNQLNILLTVSYFLLYLGTVVYKYFFLKSSWRRIYYFGFILNAIASCGQLALIRGYTFGINPFFFALGDDAIIEFIVGIQMLPICILMVTLCPPNSEGASYAMFTTAWNSAMLLAQAIGSSVLLGIWDTSKETMTAGNLNGLFNLSVLTTFLQMLPIIFVWWLPHGRTELVELAHDRQGDNNTNNSGSSRIGGGIFLLVVLSSVLYTIIVTLLNVLVPGWIGES
jgi:MFS family permease